VSLIAPGLDIADSLRTVVEEYLVAEARGKLLSRAGGLSMLTDVVIWLKMGPAAMLRSLAMVERRQVRLRSRHEEPGQAEARLRSKVSAVRSVWTVLVVFLALSGGLPSWQAAPMVAAVAAVFVTSWTLWMLFLMRRVETR
jgi:hypothetical protein